MGTIEELHAMSVSEVLPSHHAKYNSPPPQLFTPLQVSILANCRVLLRVWAAINLGLKDTVKF